MWIYGNEIRKDRPDRARERGERMGDIILIFEIRFSGHRLQKLGHNIIISDYNIRCGWDIIIIVKYFVVKLK